MSTGTNHHTGSSGSDRYWTKGAPAIVLLLIAILSFWSLALSTFNQGEKPNLNIQEAIAQLQIKKL